MPAASHSKKFGGENAPPLRIAVEPSAATWSPREAAAGSADDRGGERPVKRSRRHSSLLALPQDNPAGVEVPHRRQAPPPNYLPSSKDMGIGDYAFSNSSPHACCNTEYHGVPGIHPYPDNPGATVASVVNEHIEKDAAGSVDQHWTVTSEEHANRQHAAKQTGLSTKAPNIRLSAALPIPGQRLAHPSAYNSTEWMERHRYLNKEGSMVALQNDPSKFVTMIFGRPVLLVIMNFPESMPDSWSTYIGYQFRPLRPIYIHGVQGGGPLAPELDPGMAVCNAFKDDMH